MKTMKKATFVLAFLGVFQILLLGSPYLASSAICPPGYTSMGGLCVKSSTPYTTTSQSIPYEGELGSFAFVRDENNNLVLLQSWSHALNIYQFNTSQVEYDMSRITLPDESIRTQFQVWTTDPARSLIDGVPNWLFDRDAATITRTQTFTDADGNIDSFFFWSGNFYDFILHDTTIGHVDRPNTSVMGIPPLENAYGVQFVGTRFAVRDPDPVPEPSTILLLGGGLAGLAGFGIRRRLKNRG